MVLTLQTKTQLSIHAHTHTQVTHARQVNAQIARASTLSEIELYGMAKEIGAPIELLRETARLKKLPVVMFSAGGIASPADAALMMKHGMDGVFVCVWSLCLCVRQSQRLTSLVLRSQRLWHLQVAEPRGFGKSHRHRHHALQRPAQGG